MDANSPFRLKSGTGCLHLKYSFWRELNPVTGNAIKRYSVDDIAIQCQHFIFRT
jgi:hypothetical protein